LYVGAFPIPTNNNPLVVKPDSWFLSSANWYPDQLSGNPVHATALVFLPGTGYSLSAAPQASLLLGLSQFISLCPGTQYRFNFVYGMYDPFNLWTPIAKATTSGKLCLLQYGFSTTQLPANLVTFAVPSSWTGSVDPLVGVTTGSITGLLNAFNVTFASAPLSAAFPTTINSTSQYTGAYLQLFLNCPSNAPAYNILNQVQLYIDTFQLFPQ
jgi:hypothetical protein